MTTAELIEEIRQRAKLLPVEERRALGLELLDGDDGAEEWDPSPALVAEIERRCADIDAGRAKLLTLPELDAFMRERFGW